MTRQTREEATVKERPIIFNGEMVRAILDGRKTQTRRVVREQLTADIHKEVEGTSPVDRWARMGNGWYPSNQYGETWMNVNPLRCPYGVPGDRLYVRETWGALWPDMESVPLEGCNIVYRADLPPGCTDYPGEWPEDEARGNPDAPKWRPSIHMPKWAARIWLEVTGVRVERLQGISEVEALAEGCSRRISVDSMGNVWDADAIGRDGSYRDCFVLLWNEINAKRGYGWDENPFVWVVSFRVIERP